MSGRKYSRVELAESVRSTLECRSAAERVYARARSLMAAVDEAAETVESLRPVARSAAETLDEAGHKLDEISQLFTEGQLMKLTMAEVNARRADVQRLSQCVEDISRKCEECSAAAALRVRLSGLLKEMESCRSELEPWLCDVYSSFERETRDMLIRMDEQLASGVDMSRAGGLVSEKVGEFSAMRDTSEERRSLDAQRRYVADSLQAVCREMGFSTSVLPQSGPLEDLVIEVDTYAYGIIHFRLELDGMIRSQSEMIEASCSDHFEKIEEGLKALGVLGGFRYEGDQRPVRIQKGEKSEPDEGAAVVLEQGRA